MRTQTYGPVSGFHRDGCSLCLGIPFAKPPVGELSFRHPEEPDAWTEVLRAERASSNPIQARGGAGIGNNSQDCLYLNVFAPDGADHLPVTVWIYGGSYAQGGAGAEEREGQKLLYDLTRFARETNTVAVTVNYRLNVYGFLNLHALDERFDQNNGLYDQILALKFVKENIRFFGGNPDNVTVFGQSAGGACILALMTMPEAKGLFHRAIVQSACIEHFFSEEEGRKNAVRYLKTIGVKEAGELSAMPAERIESANRRYSNALLMSGDVRCAFSPIIDGQTLREEPKTAVQRCGIPLLIGNTSGEANPFLSGIPGFLLPFVTRLLHLKVGGGRGSYRQRACDALTEHIYIRPQLEILEHYSGPAWRYEYRYVSPESRYGCFHASELPALFGIEISGLGSWDPGMEDPGRELRRIWSAFAWNGDPGWKQYKEGGRGQAVGANP